MSVTEKLARFIVETRFADFDDGVVSYAKDLLLNGIGAQIPGSNEKVSELAIRVIRSEGGNPDVGVVGQRFRTSLGSAVYVGGISVHAIEQEACGRFPGGPPFALIPTAFSVAEKYGLSGTDVIEGFVIGHEIQGRLGIGCPGGSNRGWSGVYFTMGVVACAARMLKLDVMQTRMALGIAADTIGGTWRHCGYMNHFGQGAGFCRNGLTAAMLAKEGLTADPDIIDGEGGFGDWVGEYDPEKLLKNLGSPFYTLSPSVAIKKYNVCFGQHRALEALWELIWENDIHLDQVDNVTLIAPKFVTKLIRYPEPADAYQAKFSFEHAFAVLLVDRLPNQMTRAWSFSDEGANEPKYVEARKKVKVILTEQEGGRSLVGKEMPVTINMKDGRTFTKEAMVLKGSPESPLSRHQLVARYKEHVGDFMSPAQVDQTVEMLCALEKQPNVAQLMSIATFGKALHN